MIRILVYPNITFQKDLNKDSYIIVIKNVIEVLNKMRDDLYFVMLLPAKIDYLNLPNVEQRIYPQPTYPPSMRIHFNFDDLSRLIRPEDEFDLVYCHLPEHAKQLKIFFDSYTQERPDFIGYCHWFEVKENASYPQTSFWTNIMGVLEMKQLGVNSKWLKDLIIERAAERLNSDTIRDLDNIIQPHYLGVDSIDLEPVEKIPNSILFNHRAGAYTGLKFFLDAMDELYLRRQDFTVYLTTADANRPYIKKMNISDRQEYFKFLKTMTVGVGTFQGYSAWSISVTDGFSRGLPYLLPYGYCYPEMLGEHYPLFHNGKQDIFLMQLERCLDPQDDYLNAGRQFIKDKITSFLWENRVPEWFDNWQILNELSRDNETPVLLEIVKKIHIKGVMTKTAIIKWRNWGRDIKFTPYRRMLRNQPDIKITKTGYESKINPPKMQGFFE